MSAAGRARFRGAPLALFVVVIAGWISGRVLLWENPLAAPARSLALAPADLPLAGPPPERFSAPLPPPALAPAAAVAPRPGETLHPPAARRRAAARRPALALPGAPSAQALLPPAAAEPARSRQTAPFPDAAPGARSRRERWSLDAWGFFRQGSDAAPISQGLVPIYGASQLGAVVQFRLAPGARRDPRLYLRAYRALVARGESEGAAGASIRPIAGVPLRAFAELRYTDAPFGRELRPSLFIASELPPQALPGELTLEAYGQAGWVGGGFATPFADGQVSLVRELARVTAPGGRPLRLSVGAGAWGGAQRGAERVDIGPTVRLEAQLGRVPARLSIDWRQQVAGDAAPESGVAATLSTSF